MRTNQSITISNQETIKRKLFQWGQSFNEVVWLDSNNHKNAYTDYDAILAVDAKMILKANNHNAFQKLDTFINETKDWLFGYLGYDLKNDIEILDSSNIDGAQFPDLFFFQPKKLFLLKGRVLTISYLNEVDLDLSFDIEKIKKIRVQEIHDDDEPIKIKLRTHKDAYFEKVETILKHIHRGDIYETNFCQEFYAEDIYLQPEIIFQKLNNISKPPFASFLKSGDYYVLSASPERYLKKKGCKIISQPIKGTAPRSAKKEEDEQLRLQLAKDPKERSENIMIVDLVRHDLSRTAIKGTVNVEELCKVYSFLQVHQMISTITSEVSENASVVDILKTTFPMGSMTGAPKISAMQIIEELEDAKRGVYSGAVGYIDPNFNFDFNVVIRSILYNASKRYVSFSVGSAITAKSDPLSEYEECLVKAKAMREVLENYF